MRLDLFAALLTVPAITTSIVWAQAPDTSAEARQLLEQAAKNVAGMKGASFKATFSTMGMGLTMGGNGEMQFFRAAESPDKLSSFAGKGAMQVPALADGDFEFALLKGDTVQWLDLQRKALVQRGAKIQPVSKGAEQAGRAQALLIPPFFFEPKPFELELKTTEVAGQMQGLKMQIVRDEMLGDTKCAVINIAVKEGESERLIWIGRDDKFPRGYEQARTRGARIGRTWQIQDLKLHTDWAHETLTMKVPAGFATDIQAPTAPVAGVNDLPPKPVQAQTSPAGGPQIGQLAPVVSGKTDAGSFSMDTLKGKPAILVFWGPLFPTSATAIKAAADAAKTDAAKGAVIVGVTARGEGADRKGLAAAFSGFGAPADATLLTDTNESLPAFTIRGFPSTVAINAEGRVVGFFEGEVTSAEIEAAFKGPAKN